MRQSAINLGQLMTDIPADDGSQITGRIFALEIILRQLLETHPDIENFLNETDARLDRQEAALLKAAPNEERYIVNMLEGGRMTVDEFRFQLVGRRTRR